MKTEQIPSFPANSIPWVMCVPVVTTRHIQADDNKALHSEPPGSGPMMARLSGGFLLDIDDLAEWQQDCCYSDAFLHLLETFHNLGFHHLRLDSDGQDYEDLPVFNW